MIAYEELVSALNSWRLRQGLPVSSEGLGQANYAQPPVELDTAGNATVEVAFDDGAELIEEVVTDGYAEELIEEVAADAYAQESAASYDQPSSDDEDPSDHVSNAAVEDAPADAYTQIAADAYAEEPVEEVGHGEYTEVAEDAYAEEPVEEVGHGEHAQEAPYDAEPVEEVAADAYAEQPAVDAYGDATPEPLPDADETVDVDHLDPEQTVMTEAVEEGHAQEAEPGAPFAALDNDDSGAISAYVDDSPYTTTPLDTDSDESADYADYADEESTMIAEQDPDAPLVQGADSYAVEPPADSPFDASIDVSETPQDSTYSSAPIEEVDVDSLEVLAEAADDDPEKQ